MKTNFIQIIYIIIYANKIEINVTKITVANIDEMNPRRVLSITKCHQNGAKTTPSIQNTT